MDIKNKNELIIYDMSRLGRIADIYKKRAGDMTQLTDIANLYNTETGQWSRAMTRQECVFLYELDASIEGFGYDTDPRIAELRQARKDANLLEQDMLTIFECEPGQIARSSASLITEETKAYVGPLYPNIFKILAESNVEHVYTSFPERRIRMRTIEIGGESKDRLRQRMTEKNIAVSEYAKSMLDSTECTTDTQTHPFDTVRLTVRDLGFPNGAEFKDIYTKADALGLDLCPAEVGPHYRLQYTDQPMNSWLSIGMKPISDSDGLPFAFTLDRDDEGLWLYDSWTYPQVHWDADHEFVFSPRK